MLELSRVHTNNQSCLGRGGQLRATLSGVWIILISNKEYPLYCGLWRSCSSQSIQRPFSHTADSPIPDDPVATCEYITQRRLSLQRRELSSEILRVGACICGCCGLGCIVGKRQTTFKDVDDLLNPRRIDDFDRLQQESVWLYFGPTFRLVACFSLLQEL